ncbi:uncharacterized protein LOC142588477 isoform X1 [Dermacentor variabilis]|uniref:uncharacterized protein LOC142588477 isoform X1 n=1 Tax=Dermacentor variabilis TaxID=34621 RepID=UPI003F5C46F5
MEHKETSPTRETTELRRLNSLPMDDSGHELQDKSLGMPPFAQGQMLDCEKDFMEFLLTLPAEPLTTSKSLERTRRHSKGTKAKPKVGLDHLDNLCKLMEQLGDLKEQNHKLQRRVQYLEDMKDLHDMQRLLDPDYGLEERRASYRTPSPGGSSATRALGVLEDGVHRSRTQVALRSRECCRSRERSKSVGTQDDFADSRSIKSKRFPNWSRVKEALGLERSATECEGTSKGALACTSASDGGSFQDEGLAVPVTDGWPAAWDAGPVLPPQSCSWSEESFPGRMQGEVFRPGSTAHATLRPGEPVRRKSSPTSPSCVRDACKKTVLDSKCHCHLDSDSLYPDVGDSYGSRELCKKVPKSAWGRVKNLIQTGRETVKRQQPSRNAKPGSSQTPTRADLRVDSDPANCGVPSDPEDSLASRRREVRRRKASDQLGSSSRNSRTSDDLQFLPKEHSKSQSHIQSVANQLDVECETNQKSRLQQQVSCPSEHEVSKLTLAASERSNAPSPQSPQSQRKSRWNRVKKVFSGATQDKKEEEPPGASNPSSPLSTTLVFDFDDLGACEGERSAPRRSEDAAEALSSNPTSLCHSSTAPVSSLVQELQRNLSEDFNQKILEWERMKAAKSGRSPRPVRKSSVPHRTTVVANKGTRDKTKAPRPDKKKDLTWVNRELQKMEREKERLSRETHKYQERSVRLHRLRQALLNAPASSNEVLVRTSAGEFRFEGISNAFTKKLYEWETKKGVVPEFSTIALLDASLQTTGRNGDKAAPGNVRVLSRSESSVVEPSNTLQSRASTSSLPSMKPDTLLVPEDKKEVSRSRANSEPDLCSSGNKNGCTTSRPRTVSVGSAETGFAHPEVTWLIDSGSGEIDDQFEPKPCQEASETKHAEDSYYTLLEENMLLLEQLRAKENVCARLEANLERLDERLELMSSRHREEIERYRESLWNAHRPAGVQRGSLASLKAAADFRYRLEDLERCNFRLQEERRALQETIRSHSQEQASLIWDIVDKVKELQALNTDIHSSDVDGRRTSLMRLDADGLARIQQLSEQLLQSAQLLEAAVAERTNQVCQLRRELLMCELASAGRGATKPSRSLRTLRSASDGVLGAVRSLHSDEGVSKSGLRISTTSPAVERGPGPSVQLMETVHKLRSELLRLFAFHGSSSALGEDPTEEAAPQGPSVNQVPDTADLSRRPNGFRENARHSLASSSESPSHRSAPEALASGHDGSESSSINDSEHVALGLRLPRSCWARARDTLSTSSDSSCLEDDSFTRMALSSGGARRLGESHDWRRLERDHGRRVSCCGDYEDDVFNDPSSTSSLEVAYNLAWKSRDRHDPSAAHRHTSNTTDAPARLSQDLTLSFPLQKARSDSPTSCNARNETADLCRKEGRLSNSPHRISFSLSDHDHAKTDRGALSEVTERNYESTCKSKAERRFRKECSLTDHEHDQSDLWISQEPCHSEAQRSHKPSESTSSSLQSRSRDVCHKGSLTSSRHGQSSYYIPHTSMMVPVAMPQSAKELASSNQEVTAFPFAAGSPPSPRYNIAAGNVDALLEQSQKLEFSHEDSTTQHPKSRQEPTEKSFLSLRLRRPKKKDYSAIGQLCRQTLPLSISDETESPPETLNSMLERSASPVTARSRSFSRTKWLPLFVTKS